MPIAPQSTGDAVLSGYKVALWATFTAGEFAGYVMVREEDVKLMLEEGGFEGVTVWDVDANELLSLRNAQDWIFEKAEWE